MGEYGIDQMMRDYRRMTGVDADRAYFEDDDRPRKVRLKRTQCGRLFRVPHAVVQHRRDKHGMTTSQKSEAKR